MNMKTNKTMPRVQVVLLYACNLTRVMTATILILVFYYLARIPTIVGVSVSFVTPEACRLSVINIL